MNRTPELIEHEILNGVWFILGAFLICAFIARLYQRIQEGGDWYSEPAVQAVIALLVYFTGSIMRSAWIWSLLICRNSYGYADNVCLWYESYILLIVASLLAIVGATCAIRVLSPPHWRPWSWLVSAALAIAIPVVVHLSI